MKIRFLLPFPFSLRGKNKKFTSTADFPPFLMRLTALVPKLLFGNALVRETSVSQPPANTVCETRHSQTGVWERGRFRAIFLLGSAIALSACHEKAPTEVSAFALPTATITIGKETVTAEVADTPENMHTGLMYRKTMADDHGMIFVFPELRQASFWMHNTDLPLDIAYLDRTGRVREIHPAKPHDDTSIHSATTDIAYALEMNQGWFQKHGLKTGVNVQGLPAFPARK